MMKFILDPWPWYFAGPLLALVLYLMLNFGKTFGFSSNLRTMCTMAGGARFSDLFDIDWKAQSWNLIFLLGTIIGAYIASHYLMVDQVIDLNPKTAAALADLNINSNVNSYVPKELFDPSQLSSGKTLAILIGGGLMVGFGTRWAGGCTSGHAITGLSNLQLPSLIATIGFFIGGLLMTHFLLPIILG